MSGMKLGFNWGLGQLEGGVPAAAAPPNTVIASAGTFIVTGENMTPVIDYVFAADVGAFTLAGQAATLVPPAPAYTGPGDVAGWSGAYAHYGLRAYNAAFAATQGALIRIATNDAGANGTDIHCQTNGQINLTEIATFKSTYSATTIYVSRIYDQSGNGRHLTTAVLTFETLRLAENAIATTLPAFDCAPSRLLQSGSGTGGTFDPVVNNTAQAQPITVGYVAKFNGDGGVFSDGSFGFLMGRPFPTGRRMSAGGNADFTVGTDGTWESGQAVYNSSSSTLRVNNSALGTGDPSTNGISNTVPMTMGAGPGAFYLNPGLIFEITIIGGSAVSGANQSALYTNQNAAGLV